MWKCKHCKDEFDLVKPGEKANHSRWCKDNPKRKEYLKTLSNTRKTYITEEVVERRNKSVKKAWDNGCYENADFGSGFRGKHHTVDTKNRLSKARRKFLKENPDKHPWKRKDKFTSVPCERLKEKLIENELSFIEEVQPLSNRFFSIDIAFPDYKIGIEVNGQQHYNKNGSLKKYYRDRHNLIEENGWKIKEIHYSKIYDDKFIEELVIWLYGVTDSTNAF